MRSNAIIMTSGLAGSSVLAGLVAEAGFWSGEQTFKKADYNTYENQELVDLNRRILKEVGYTRNFTMEYRHEDVVEVARRAQDIDPRPYREFIERCNQHRPWVWKDPRLWLTIRFWKTLLDLDDVQFLLLTREEMQTWISTTIRRQIQTREYCRNYLNGVRGSILEFFHDNRRPYVEIVYEDLLVKPEDTLRRINDFLGTGLTMDDMRRVYHGPLYRKQRGLVDMLNAYLIYFKNYRERYQ